MREHHPDWYADDCDCEEDPCVCNDNLPDEGDYADWLYEQWKDEHLEYGEEKGNKG